MKKAKRSRTEFIAFYVSEEEKKQIVSYADENDQSISDYCRKTLLKKREASDYVRKDS